MKKLATLLVMIGMIKSAQSQLTVINFSAVTDTINSSSTTVTFSNVNVGNTDFFIPFSDSLYLGFGLMDTSFTFLDTAYVGVVSILPLDSTYIPNVNFNVSPALFKEGNNTVIIWPYSTTTPTLDSLFFNMTYLRVNELVNNNLPIKLGPNPTSESFYLADPENLVKRVRIRNAEGKLMCTRSTNEIIWVHDFEKGIYLIEMETANGIFGKKLIVN